MSCEEKPEYIIAHEWVGLDVYVAESPNKDEIGISGEVVDETMNTFIIKTEKGLRKVAKRNRIFKVRFCGNNIRISGNYLNFRPEDRIKKGIMLLRRFKR
ncbi:MAG TPA: ribonuclease P protein component 1 [Archaeoglobaceae archaeon]|nr:ribonuclease P protein component 1 [Archaeoglobaceae archaeon]